MQTTPKLHVPKRVFLALLTICVMFAFMLYAVTPKTAAAWGFDKLAHALVSFSLAVIFLWFFQSYDTDNNGATVEMRAFCMAFAFGVFYEGCQFLSFMNWWPFFEMVSPETRMGGWERYGFDAISDLIVDAGGASLYLCDLDASDFWVEL